MMTQDSYDLQVLLFSFCYIFLHCQVKSWEHKSLQEIKNELKFASQTADLFLARWPAK